MLGTGSLAAPSICLRCQLRQAISQIRRRPLRLQTTPNPQRCRYLAGSARLHQDSEHDVFADNSGFKPQKRNVYRQKYPLGRIVGAPGRRQRETSAVLKIDSMQEPFEVVLMQDVAEPKRQTLYEASKKEDTTSATDTALVAGEILEDGVEPTQAEVNESIELLRPNTNLLPSSQYRALSRRLSNGYNKQQLSSYFQNALKLFDINADSVRLIKPESTKRRGFLQRSPWRPGKTPLEKRHAFGSIVKKSEIGSNKARLVEQILRLAWSLKIQSEEQSVGELEIKLESWQMPYIFDFTLGGMPIYENLIDTPLLRRMSDIRPYRPDNTMRITARRQDAEDVADQLEQRLRDVKAVVLDFRPLLGKQRHPEHSNELFRQSELEEISRHSKCVIEWKDRSKLAIYSLYSSAQQHAARLVLQLLNLPSLSYTRMASPVTLSSHHRPEAETKPGFVPEYVRPASQFKHRRLQLSRLTAPSLRSAENEAPEPAEVDKERQLIGRKEDIAQHIVECLSRFESTPALGYRHSRRATNNTESYWGQVGNASWEVQFCKLLHRDGPGQNAPLLTTPEVEVGRDTVVHTHPILNQSNQPIVQAEIPGLHKLLTYFDPKRDGKALIGATARPPNLVAHLIPSPLTKRGEAALGKLPRIEMTYTFKPDPVDEALTTLSEPPTPASAGRHLTLAGMRMILSDDSLCIPLPYESVDLRVVRQTRRNGRLGGIHQDQQIQRFSRTLQQFAQDDTPLDVEPLVKIKLPPYFFKKGEVKESDRDVEADYLFERLEVVQHMDFMPMNSSGIEQSLDPAMASLMESMLGKCHLHLKEAEGGLVGGKSTEVALRYASTEEQLVTEPGKVGKGRHLFDLSYSPVSKEKVMQRDVQLVKDALGIVEALTKINAGQLEAFQASNSDGTPFRL